MGIFEILKQSFLAKLQKKTKQKENNKQMCMRNPYSMNFNSKK